MREKLEIDISAWSIVKVVLVLAAFYLLYFLRDIITLLFVVLILVMAMKPVIDKIEPKIGRRVSVIAIAVLAIWFLALIIYLVVPPIVVQVTGLVATLPDIVSHYDILSSHRETIVNSINNISGGLTGSFVAVTKSIFGGFFTVLTAIVLTIYMLLDRKSFAKLYTHFFPNEERRETISEVVGKVSNKVGSWFRGQVLLGFIIGAIDLIGLLIIGVPYALALATLSGLLEFIPTIGPIIAGVFAALVALSISPIKAILVIVMYVLVQQLENTILVPRIMQKAVGLSPVIIIFAIITGAKLLGLTGAILAIPVTASLVVLIQEWSELKKAFGSSE